MDFELKKLFIALPITEQQGMFKSMQDYFKRVLDARLDPGEFRPSKDLHITVAYIGLITTSHMPTVEQAIQQALLQFCALGKEARLLWQREFHLFNNAVGLTFAYDEGLRLLATRIRDALTDYEISFDELHAFRAHLTIGRIKPNELVKKNRIRRLIVETLAQETAHELDPIVITQIGLYESGTVEPLKTYSCP